MQLHPELETRQQHGGLQACYILTCSSYRCHDFDNVDFEGNIYAAELVAHAHEKSWRKYQGRKSAHMVVISISYR